MVLSPFEKTDVSHDRRISRNSKFPSRFLSRRSAPKRLQVDSTVEHAKARVGRPLGAEQEFRSLNGASQPAGCVFPNRGSHGWAPGLSQKRVWVEVATIVAMGNASWNTFEIRLTQHDSRRQTDVRMHNIVLLRAKNPAKPNREG
jgi:hypothetical protein